MSTFRKSGGSENVFEDDDNFKFSIKNEITRFTDI